MLIAALQLHARLCTSKARNAEETFIILARIETGTEEALRITDAGAGHFRTVEYV